MATGDIKNNMKKLQGSLKTVKYEKDLDIESISKGIATAYLPIYHYLFIDYSQHLAEKISELNIELQGKNDLRFIESVYKVLRELFSYKPSITKDQFFAKSFGERKVIMTTEIINMVAKKHKSLAPKPRVKVNLSINSTTTVPANTSRLGSRPSTAPVGSAHNIKKTDTKTTKSKPPHAPVLPQVVNEVMDPSNNTQAATTLSMAAPNLPLVSVAQSREAQSYHPAAYACGPGAQTEQSSVEIVSLQSSEDSEFPENSNSGNTVRPIDIVKTPGRPLVESHRSIPSLQHNVQSSPVQYTSPQQSAQQATELHLSHVLQTITTLTEKVSGIEGRITAMEGLLSVQQKEQQKQQVLNPSQQLENMTARLTLLENRMTLMESKETKNNTGAPKTYQPLNYQSKPPSYTTGQTPLAAGSAANEQYLPENHFERQYSNGHDSPDKENKKPAVETQSASDAGFSDSLENVSPIPQTSRTTTLQSSGSPENKTTPSIKENFRPVHQCSTPADSLTQNGTESKYEQTERIKNMLKQTEDMLNIQVDLPSCSPVTH